jgi:hypothetical protein
MAFTCTKITLHGVNILKAKTRRRKTLAYGVYGMVYAKLLAMEFYWRFLRMER